MLETFQPIYIKPYFDQWDFITTMLISQHKISNENNDVDISAEML